MTDASLGGMGTLVTNVLRAQQFEHLETFDASTTSCPVIRSRLRREWQSSVRGSKRFLRFDLELAIMCAPAQGAPRVFYSRGEALPVELRFASRIATSLGRRTLLAIGGHADVGELALFDISGSDQVPMILRTTDDRPDPVEPAIRELVAAARASVDEGLDEALDVCRIVFPVLVIPAAFMECSRTRSGALRMMEREEATLVWPETTAEETERALVQIVRDRAFMRYVARARAAFEHLHRHHRRDVERGLATLGG